MNFDEYHAHIKLMDEFLEDLKHSKINHKKTKALRKLVRTINKASKDIRDFSFEVDESLDSKKKSRKDELDEIQSDAGF